jgi:hypothetical protein
MESTPKASVIHVTDTLRLRVFCVHTEQALMALLPECSTDEQRRATALAVLKRHDKVRDAFLKAAKAHRAARGYHMWMGGWLHPEMPPNPEMAWRWWTEQQRKQETR